MDILEKTLLETLSFYTPMTREEILRGLDEKVMSENGNLTVDDLDRKLVQLKKRGVVKCSKNHNQNQNHNQRIEEVYWTRTLVRKNKLSIFNLIFR